MNGARFVGPTIRACCSDATGGGGGVEGKKSRFLTLRLIDEKTPSQTLFCVLCLIS